MANPESDTGDYQARDYQQRRLRLDLAYFHPRNIRGFRQRRAWSA
ncbi:hypothetical protein [Streptomyces sp. NPDC057284]